MLHGMNYRGTVRDMQRGTQPETVRSGFLIEPTTHPSVDTADVFPVEQDRWTTGGGRHRPMRVELDRRADDWIGPRNVDSVEVVAQLDDDWRLRVEAVLGADRSIRWRRLSFEPTREEVSDLSVRHLRRLGYGDVIETASGWLRHLLAVGVLGLEWYDAPKNPGRGGKSDYDYLDIARQYADACADDPRRAIQRLVDAQPAADYATAAQLKARIGRARKRGLLTEAQHGKASGELTEKALAMIAQLERKVH